MPTISISYRRDDTGPVTGRLSDRLIDRYGAKSVFVDIDSIPAGVDFRHHIHAVLQQTDVLLAMVGTRWLGPQASGETRIHQEDDPVRVEIATAFRNKILIVPVLVDGAKMPAETELPDEIKPFAYRNAVGLSSGKDFNVHVQRLVAEIDRAVAPDSMVAASGGSSEKGTPTTRKRELPIDAPVAARQPAIGTSLLATYLIFPLVLLLLAHYLIVMKFNLDPFYMRAASIVVPAAFGFALFARENGGPVAALLWGAGAGAVALLAMLATVGLVDNRAIIPSSAFEWQETIEYFVGICLAAVGGNLIARAAAAVRKKAALESGAD
jgi:TIR domain